MNLPWVTWSGTWTQQRLFALPDKRGSCQSHVSARPSQNLKLCPPRRSVLKDPLFWLTTLEPSAGACLERAFSSPIYHPITGSRQDVYFTMNYKRLFRINSKTCWTPTTRQETTSAIPIRHSPADGYSNLRTLQLPDTLYFGKRTDSRTVGLPLREWGALSWYGTSRAPVPPITSPTRHHSLEDRPVLEKYCPLYSRYL
ncbi:unnamed protein product [Nezara viridula]|uniref:Uncharacterized protein n=1 Tax=Nezara viridula TaxID=85310 RepID=A0A9P0MS61_NEZVI|nr:unnamed protein product [Nezara viridula]